MQTSPTTTTTVRTTSFGNLKQNPVKYYYPAVKIRSLIKNLDEELRLLSQQCTLNRPQVIKQKKSSLFGMYPKSNTNLFNTQHTTFPSYNLLLQTQNINGRTLLPNNNNNSNNNATVKQDSNAHLRTLASIYRARVIEAYRNRKIFTIHGNYYTIRRALLRRGWLEKLPSSRYPKLQTMSEETLLQNAKRGNEYEAVAISRIINHFPAFFVWQSKGQRDEHADVHPYRNRVRRNGRLDFTTKVGLIGCGECAHWFTQDNVCRMCYPRCYRLKNNSEERSAFVDDFRNTQCRSLLRFVWENMTGNDVLVDNEVGTVDADILKFALDNLKQQMNEFEKVDTVESKPDSESDLENWQNFLTKSSAVLREHAKFRAPTHEVMEAARLGRVMLDKIESHRPDYKWDGCRNLWILKPGYSCRGMGIIIRSNLEDIVHWVSINSARYYIVQKYIERPLLIYKTKFDIRQYLLLVITNNTVNIWLYRDCYLRFSSQEFTIDDLRESIHLTNNSVQKKYKSKPGRDSRLPRSNMWTLDQFKAYLKTTDASSDVWSEKIYKGFKENLITVVLASLEETDLVENAFELYGCDFMLDENYNPILIEINSTPDLSPSTDVTAHICPMALRDLLKVVVDRPQNNHVDTGLFEMVYEIDYKTKDEAEDLNGLQLSGHTMKIERQRLKRKLPVSARSVSARSKKKIVVQDEPGVQFVPTKSVTNVKPEILNVKNILKALPSKKLKASGSVSLRYI